MTVALMVGLRNPGASYASTRHNAGEWFIQSLLKRYSGTCKTESKLHGDLCQCDCESGTMRCLLPNTFMNRSGQAVQATCHFFKLQPQEILLAHDDLDLPIGRIKLKFGGGHGGHNGLQDTISKLGSSDFYRLRIGIGHPGHKDLVTSYVLGKASLQEKIEIENAIERVMPAIPHLQKGEFALAMNLINR